MLSTEHSRIMIIFYEFLFVHLNGMYEYFKTAIFKLCYEY
jgi:hypothetical protein